MVYLHGMISVCFPVSKMDMREYAGYIVLRSSEADLFWLEKEMQKLIFNWR